MGIRIAALLLTGLTGFTGLVYEVTWQKYLGTLLGSQSEATAAILAIFLGGLSVGYSLFGRVTARLTAGRSASRASSRLLLAYGGIELAIGVYAFLFHRLFHHDLLTRGHGDNRFRRRLQKLYEVRVHDDFSLVQLSHLYHPTRLISLI